MRTGWKTLHSGLTKNFMTLMNWQSRLRFFFFFVLCFQVRYFQTFSKLNKCTYLLTYNLHNRNGQFWPYLHNYAWLHPSYFCYFINFQPHGCKNEVNVAISENSLHVPYIKEQVKLVGRKSWIPAHGNMHQIRGPTDNGHPERPFFQKFESFGLGQTNWAEILGCILVISSQTIGTIESLVHGKL